MIGPIGETSTYTPARHLPGITPTAEV